MGHESPTPPRLRPDGPSFLSAWFERLHAVLRSKSDMARLIGHNPTTGTLREFFVREVLSQFIPRAFGFTSGKVVASNGGESRQVDVIIYDLRFPVFEIAPGQCLCPSEAVVAAIEVKSQLDGPGLVEALDNCYSVNSLLRMYYRSSNSKLPQESCDQVRQLRAIGPATCIFAFSGLTRSALLRDAVQAWVASSEAPRAGIDVPSIVVTQSCVGLFADGLWKIPVLMENGVSISQDDPPPPPRLVRHPIWYCAETQRTFGWLAAYLLHCCGRRLSAVVGPLNDRPHIDAYLPIEEYVRDGPEAQGWRAVYGRWLRSEPDVYE